ncbi:hypothetical protein MACH17_16040 [Phaeobacter inhibens]|uniref:hypothetical protein n=1 Tax=Phaeobacter inhibens TaxID=221822 RepID=UPI00275EF7F8|nr:hypothetical protein [Phaeobacter inhibens]GLO70087.1 hypothetical protein MACH17_16040 [Phaeobacter inhibens]
MSTDTDPQSDAEAVTITVQKSDVESLLSGRTEAGLDGEFLWPIEPRNLALLYRASAEHGRAIQIKAESAFGGGLIGDAERIEELCETGAAEMFTLLGLDLETYANAFLQKIRSSDGERIIGLRRLPAITMCRYRAGFMQRVGLPNGQTRKVTFKDQQRADLSQFLAADHVPVTQPFQPFLAYAAAPLSIAGQELFKREASITMRLV